MGLGIKARLSDSAASAFTHWNIMWAPDMNLNGLWNIVIPLTHLPTFLTIKTDGRGNKDGGEMGKNLFFVQKQLWWHSVLSGRALKWQRLDRTEGWPFSLRVFVCFPLLWFALLLLFSSGKREVLLQRSSFAPEWWKVQDFIDDTPTCRAMV